LLWNLCAPLLINILSEAYQEAFRFFYYRICP